MANYRIVENKIVDENNKVLMESSRQEELTNVLGVINDLKQKLECDTTGAFTKFKLSEDIEKTLTNLIFIDVNSLKKINDKFGHHKGDKLLTSVVTLLKKFGNVYRQGGDEFILLIENDEMLANFQKKYQNTKLFSYGICLKTEYKNISQACRLADKRMYEHKERQHKQTKIY